MADIPTAFDWISLVVVPALLGLGSLTVAYASWRVARASHALATKLDRRDEAAQRREDRYRVAESVTLWTHSRWGGGDEHSPAHKAETARLRTLASVALVDSDQPQAKQMQSILWELDHTTDADGEIARVFVAGAMTSYVEQLLGRWITHPERPLPTDDQVNEYAAEMKGKGEQREADLIEEAVAKRESRASKS